MSTTNTRSSYWDNIKGLMMILTVFAHIILPYQHITAFDNTFDYIYMFHMPVFVFISGFFGKSESSRSFGSVMKLAVLYFVFNSIVGALWGSEVRLAPLYSYWYLLALIFWRLTAHRISKLPHITLLLIAVSFFAGFFSAFDNTFALARIIGFYPFYMSGYLLSKQDSEALVSRRYSARAVKGLLAAVLCAGIMFLADMIFSYTDEALQMFPYGYTTEAYARLVLYIIGALAIMVFRYITPDRKLPLITEIGRNSLPVFILHRPLTLLITDNMKTSSSLAIFLVALAGTAAICLLTGNNIAGKLMTAFCDGAAELFDGKGRKCTVARVAVIVVAIGYAASAILGLYSPMLSAMGDTSEDDENAFEETADVLFNIMSDEQQAEFDDAIRLTFAGDLILLEDQVKRAYTGSGYDFTDVFEYAESYISSADLAIGVFEGPMAGGEAGYTGSNYDDSKELYLNFPDEFGVAVKAAGFDLVTTANNHLLDKGIDGALRTLDVLDSIGLDHTGSYRNAEEKQASRVKIVEVSGIKLAVLSYTYGSNYYSTESLASGTVAGMTSIISGTEGELFEQLRTQVEEDFALAKSLDPDLIVVLPHMGTQFMNEPDKEQTVWFGIFKENGADIILGDHSHSVQPAVLEEYDGRSVFTAYCPGNFANIYRKNQGDTSMLVDVYIDRASKKPIGGSIVPLYTQAAADGNFRALPVYEIENNTELRKQLSTDDLERAAYAHATVTRVVFGHSMDMSAVTPRYYFDETGFLRTPNKRLELTEDMRDGILYNAMQSADTICFLGDSVTEGTKNGGCLWYEPICAHFSDKEIHNFSKGGCTIAYLNENANSIPEAQLYVIAIGTNDVRYRDEATCAMTAQDFVAAAQELSTKLRNISPQAELIFIAPWYSTDGDPYTPLSFAAKTQMNEEYSVALGKYCEDNAIAFIDANPYLSEVLTNEPHSRYLLDHIHPNCGNGVVLYSEAVLLG